MMHPDTHAELLAAIRAELQADPTSRGYEGKTAAEIAALMAAPVPPPLRHRHVAKTDVTGYLHARLALVPLAEWAETAEPSRTRTIAKSLLAVLASDVSQFLTGNADSRARVLGLFAELASAPETGITPEHYAAIEAMTIDHSPQVAQPARWLLVIDGISAAPTPELMEGEDPHPGYAGPPNAPDAALIQEALDG